MPFFKPKAVQTVKSFVNVTLVSIMAVTDSQNWIVAMRALLIIFLAGLVMALPVNAAERKSLKDVVTDQITKDTQSTARGAGDNHLALAWWVPLEFWAAVLARDPSTSETDKRLMLDAMSEIFLIAIVQADVSNLGAFTYYSKQDIEETMRISFTDAANNKRRLLPLQQINADLKIVLSVFKPILEAAMGNLGSNLHFYVFSDKIGDTGRLIDPYRQGLIDVRLERKDGAMMTASIETPLNSMFIPRKCPNGKDAHISWKYCPWSGVRLED